MLDAAAGMWAFPPMAFLGLVGLFAASDPTTLSVDGVATIGAGGLGLATLAWFARHTIMVTIPDMNRVHAESIKLLHEGFATEMAKQREVHREDMDKVWEALDAAAAARHADSQQMTGAIRELAATLATGRPRRPHPQTHRPESPDGG